MEGVKELSPGLEAFTYQATMDTHICLTVKSQWTRGSYGGKDCDIENEISHEMRTDFMVKEKSKTNKWSLSFYLRSLAENLPSSSLLPFPLRPITSSPPSSVISLP